MECKSTVLHLYDQKEEHDEARISGSYDALIALRDTINRALTHGASQTLVFACDGKG